MRQVVASVSGDLVDVGAHLVGVDPAFRTPVFVVVFLELPLDLAGDLSRGVNVEMPGAVRSRNVGELDVDGSRRMRHG